MPVDPGLVAGVVSVQFALIAGEDDGPGPDPTPSEFFEDVESHTNFTINSTTNGWSYIDGDGSETYGFSGINFPGSGMPMAYIVFNPTSAMAGGIPGLETHSGERIFASFAAVDAPNNDWIISPQLNTPTKFSFWAKTYTPDYGLERIKVGYSTTGTAQSDFTIISAGSYISVPAAWTFYEFEIPSSAKYVAINCVSDDAFVFMLDDLTITQSGGDGPGPLPVAGFEGVNIYRDGELIAEKVIGTSYLDEGVSNGIHQYCAYAVYEGYAMSCGECIEIDVDAQEPEPVCITPENLEGNYLWIDHDNYGSVIKWDIFDDGTGGGGGGDDPTPGTMTRIVLAANNVWGDGTGYVMLLDADATAFPLIPAGNFQGAIPASTFSEFEYTIPENATGSVNSPSVVTGSMYIDIPSGIYDYGIVNPDPGYGTVWVAADAGPGLTKADNFEFLPNKKYTFTMSLYGDNDGTAMTVEDFTDFGKAAAKKPQIVTSTATVAANYSSSNKTLSDVIKPVPGSASLSLLASESVRKNDCQPLDRSEVLFDNNVPVGTSGLISTYFEGDNALIQIADDFQGEAGWTIEKITTGGFNNAGNTPNTFGVRFYSDNGGQPGDELYSNNNCPGVGQNAGDFEITLSTPFVLPSTGKYWVSFYAVRTQASSQLANFRFDFYTSTTANGSKLHLRDHTNVFGSGTNWMSVDPTLVAVVVSVQFVLMGTLPVPEPPAGLVGFNVYRKTGSESYAVIANVPAEEGETHYEYYDNAADAQTTYQYQVTALYEFGDGSDCESAPALTPDGGQDYVIVNITNIGESTIEARVYPNPANHTVTIESAQMNRIAVMSVVGQVVYDVEVNGSDVERLDVSQFEAGVYVLRISSEKGVSSKRITVVR
jgi:hypothetical protein